MLKSIGRTLFWGCNAIAIAVGTTVLIHEVWMLKTDGNVFAIASAAIIVAIVGLYWATMCLSKSFSSDKSIIPLPSLRK